MCVISQAWCCFPVLLVVYSHIACSLLSIWCCLSQFFEDMTGWRRRWTIVLLCFVAFMLCNMDRVNMSVAILPMQQQYGWDSRTVGLVQSSFFW